MCTDFCRTIKLLVKHFCVVCSSRCRNLGRSDLRCFSCRVSTTTSLTWNCNDNNTVVVQVSKADRLSEPNLGPAMYLCQPYQEVSPLPIAREAGTECCETPDASSM